jgi:hypothetical protein
MMSGEMFDVPARPIDARRDDVDAGALRLHR